MTTRDDGGRADIRKIRDACEEEGSLSRLGLRPAADKEIQQALIPSGGDWQCAAATDGAITRSVICGHAELALVNPRGDLDDRLEGQIAMGFRASPLMDKSLRAIFILSRDAANLELIGKIARAAIDYVEMPAPHIDSEKDSSDDT